MLNKVLNFFTPVNTSSDDFIKRIRSLVIGEGMLKEGNIRLMEFAIRDMPAEGNVLEIGSYGGLSTNLIVYLMNKHQRTNLFFTCDAWIYEGFNDHLHSIPEPHIDGREDVLRSSYSLYIKNAFIEATRFLSGKNMPFSYHMHSDLFFELWNARKSERDVFGRTQTLGGSICFAYIDGGHSREVAWKDFNNVTAHLVKGGFILLDDSGDGQNFGSAQMMSEIKMDKRFQVVARKPNYLIQKII